MLHVPESIDVFLLSLLKIWSLLLEEMEVAEEATASGVMVGIWLLYCRFFLCLDLDLVSVDGAGGPAPRARSLTGEESNSETSNPPPPPFLKPALLSLSLEDNSLLPRILLTLRPSICMKSALTGDDGVTVDRVVNEDEQEVEEEGVDCQMRW